MNRIASIIDFSCIWDKDRGEAKLGATQKLVLELIRENPRCTQKYIVATIGKDQGQVTKAINRLIELGLIVKKGVQLSAQ